MHTFLNINLRSFRVNSLTAKNDFIHTAASKHWWEIIKGRFVKHWLGSISLHQLSPLVEFLFFSIIETLFICYKSHSRFAGVTTAYLQWHLCELHRFIWHLCKSTADPNDETNERSFSDPIQGHILDKSDKYIPSRWKVDHKWKYDYLGAVSIRKTVLPGMAIPMLKIRRPNGRLIFNMEITIRR